MIRHSSSAVIPFSSFTVVSSSCVFPNRVVNQRQLSLAKSFADSVKPYRQKLFICKKEYLVLFDIYFSIIRK